MSVESYRESPGKFGPRTLRRETLSRWTGRINTYTCIVICITVYLYVYLYIYIYT